MISADGMTSTEAPGVLVAPLEHPAGQFTRADLVLHGVDHGSLSYEVRVFLNNPAATADTPRDPAQGYAGRIVVFGHGGCYGDLGHCDVPTGSRAEHDLRPRHALTPQEKIVTVTEPLHRLGDSGADLSSVTLVPVSRPPRRAEAGPTADLFRFHGLELRTYLNELDPDLDPT